MTSEAVPNNTFGAQKPGTRRERERPNAERVTRMTDDDIRKLVREGFSDGRLPNQPPVIAPLTMPSRPTQHLIEGGALRPDPCLICGGQPTQVRYSAASMTFHDRCHEIWWEEMAKLRHLSP